MINNAISYQCPHCKHSLEKTTTDPLSDWLGEDLYICFNSSCTFYRNSWHVMRLQGVQAGYRYYWSESGGEGSLLILTDNSYRDKIVTSWFSFDEETEPIIEEKAPEDPVIEYLTRIERKLDQLIMLYKERSKP